MTFAERAFQDLYPNRELPEIEIKYSGRHSPYNANVKMINNKLFFSLSKEWRSIDPTIKMGILQYLMQKLYKRKGEKTRNTMYMDLYNNFTKNLHLSIPKTKSEPYLEESFNRLNERFALGLETPNLVWGDYTKRTLGTYNYQTDTIKMSRFLEKAPQHLFDYVMYHEMLHKKVKFKHNKGRTHHHNKEFRAMERLYGDEKILERELTEYLRYKRKPRIIKQEVIAGKKVEEAKKPINLKNRDFSLRKWLFGQQKL